MPGRPKDQEFPAYAQGLASARSGHDLGRGSNIACGSGLGVPRAAGESFLTGSVGQKHCSNRAEGCAGALDLGMIAWRGTDGPRPTRE